MSTQKIRKVPLRQCLGCGEHKPKKEVLRVVRTPDGIILLDFTGKKSGRGAYICNSEACIKKLNKAKLLHKTFSCEVDADVYARIEEEFLAGK